MRSDLVDLVLYQEHETPKAYLVKDPASEDPAGIWLPKSQVERGERKSRTMPLYEFTLPEWLAIEKGCV